MNTTSDSSTNKTDFTGLEGEEADPKKDAALVALADNLQAEKDARMEERFLWVVACVVLIDVIWFKDASNATFPVVVLILELIALTILARRWGVEEISQLVERIIHSVGRGASGGNG